jgi:hypothetical protein
MATRAAKEKSNSNAFVVVALIFFIITTIGLGFGTYSGYSIDDNKAEELKKAQNENKVLKSDVEWNRFQALLYKHYLGYATKEDMAELDRKLVEFGLDKEKGTLEGLGAGSLAHKGGDAKKEMREDAQPLVNLIQESLEKRVKLNVKDGKLEDPSGYEGLLVKSDERIRTLEGKLDEKQTQVTVEAKNTEAQKQNAKAAGEAYDKELAKRDNSQKDVTLTFEKELNQLRADLKKESTDRAAEKTKAQETEAALRKQIDEKTKEADDYHKALDARTREIASLKQTREDAPKELRSDWKIQKLLPGGTTAYINLGLADNVAPQLTFSIHGVGPDGKPEQAPKGSLEVVSPQPGHVSEARITQVKDRQRNPILEGDVLFNPTWSPTQKKHVAIAGIVDLAGDGRNGLPEFIRYLERHNVVVDCYVDLNDLKVKRDGKEIEAKDGITIQTDYLVLGMGQEVIAPGLDRGGYGKELEKQVEEMRKQAVQKGVPLIALPRYLDNMGYRLPSGSTLGSPSYRFFPPAVSLPDAKPPDKKPDEKPPEKPPEKKDEKPLGG